RCDREPSFTQTYTGPARLIRWIAGRTTARTGLVEVGGPARTRVCALRCREAAVAAGQREQASRYAIAIALGVSCFGVPFLAVGSRNGLFDLSIPHRMISSFRASATIASFRRPRP